MDASCGWVACDYMDGDLLVEVAHGPIRRTSSEAITDARDTYHGVRYVGYDGYLYVDYDSAPTA